MANNHDLHEVEFKGSELEPTARRKALLEIEVDVKGVLEALTEIVKDKKALAHERIEAARGLLGMEELLNDIETKAKLADKVAEFAKDHVQSTDKLSKQLENLKPKKPDWMGEEE